MQRKAARKLTTPITNPNAVSAGPGSDGTIDNLVDEVFRWTLGGRTSSVDRKLGDAIWERDSEAILSQSFSPTTYVHSAPTTPPASSASRTKDACDLPPTSGERQRTVYDDLILLDNKLDARINNIGYILGTDTPTLPNDPLKDHETWLWSTCQILQATKPGDDVASKTLLASMLERVEDYISKIEARTKIVEGEASARQAEQFDTGK
jgi:hypothetical protein